MRSLTKEKRVLKEFQQIFREKVLDEPFDAQHPDKVLHIIQMLDLLNLAAENPSLLALEWPEGDSLKLRKAMPAEWTISAVPQEGWFELEGEIPISENHVLSMAQLLHLLRESQGGYTRRSSRWPTRCLRVRT